MCGHEYCFSRILVRSLRPLDGLERVTSSSLPLHHRSGEICIVWRDHDEASEAAQPAWRTVWCAEDPPTVYRRCGSRFSLSFGTDDVFVADVAAWRTQLTVTVGSDWETCRHLLLNQVLPRLALQMGALVFHGAGIEINGRAVLFFGATGRGKSTLANAFRLADHRILSDDAIVAFCNNGMWFAQGTYPCLRMIDEAARNGARSGPGSWKTTIVLAEGSTQAAALPFAAAFELQPEDPDERVIAVKRMQSGEGCMRLLSSVFMLDPTDHRRTGGLMRDCASLATDMPCYTLGYPRALAMLEAVRETVAFELDNAEVRAPIAGCC
ncbi:MAG: hypothetical protein ACK5JT_02035 [Hyphomicrobiaceae bacterium]